MAEELEDALSEAKGQFGKLQAQSDDAAETVKTNTRPQRPRKAIHFLTADPAGPAPSGLSGFATPSTLLEVQFTVVFSCSRNSPRNPRESPRIPKSRYPALPEYTLFRRRGAALHPVAARIAGAKKISKIMGKISS